MNQTNKKRSEDQANRSFRRLMRLRKDVDFGIAGTARNRDVQFKRPCETEDCRKSVGTAIRKLFESNGLWRKRSRSGSDGRRKRTGKEVIKELVRGEFARGFGVDMVR